MFNVALPMGGIMKDKNVIVNKIINDAKAQAEVIIGEGRAKAQAILTRAELDTRAYVGSSNAALRNHTLETLERRASVDKLDGKKYIADKRYALLERTYAAALARLANLSDNDYIGLIKNILMQVAEDNDVVDICMADSNRITKSVIDEVAKAKSIKLSLSTKYGDFLGGVYIEGTNYDKNYTLESMLSRYKEELNPQVAAILFEVK